MNNLICDTPVCPVHGKPTKRGTCPKCNAAYMRWYQRRTRRSRPSRALLDRARQRARRQNLPYSLRREDITVPINCPVLGIPLVIGGARSAASPSLDRIDPQTGYVPGNIRVISDRANRLKGDRTLAEVQSLSREGHRMRRAEYAAVANYIERESLLVEVKRKAANPAPKNPWPSIADFLEQRFRHYTPRPFGLGGK